MIGSDDAVERWLSATMTSSNPEPVPAYSRTPAGPNATPKDVGHDASLPGYTFPTRFKVGGVFTDGLLVNIEQIKGHLALLDAFSNLKTQVEGLELESSYMSKDPERRWAWFVGLAVERFDVWARSLKHKDALQPLEDIIPPLDVLMVWHSYMLNPRWYTEDGQRMLACKPLVDLGQTLGKELHRLPSLLDSPPTEIRMNAFYARVGLPFDPIQSSSVSDTKTISCPRCRAKVVVPYMKSDGTGYLQTRFRVSCTTDSCPAITKETLCARKLAENLSRSGSAPNSNLPGTFFTESKAADQKAGKQLISDITDRYDVGTTIDEVPGCNEELCLRILSGAHFSLAEIRGQFKKNKLIGRIMSAHSTPMIYSVDLGGAVLRQGSFVAKMTHLGWTKPGFFDAPKDEIVLQHAIARYHAFLDLMASSPASFFVPTLDIDLVWHTHQLMNAKYEADCKQYIGRFVDHLESTNIRMTVEQARFGTPYTHCGCPPPGDTIGQRLSRFLSSSSHQLTSNVPPSQLSPPATRQDSLAATHASEHNAIIFTSRNRKSFDAANIKHEGHAKKMEKRVKRAEKEKSENEEKAEHAMSKEEREKRQRERRENDTYYCGYGAAFLMPVPHYYGAGGHAGGCVSTNHGIVDHGVVDVGEDAAVVPVDREEGVTMVVVVAAVAADGQERS
ncbi:hypothetical protein MD484_g7833, partial [Candolleomyces efflorescens]